MQTIKRTAIDIVIKLTTIIGAHTATIAPALLLTATREQIFIRHVDINGIQIYSFGT